MDHPEELETIIIRFPASEPENATGVVLASAEKTKLYFDGIGKAVPPWWVFVQYVEIDGTQYAVIPFRGE